MIIRRTLGRLLLISSSKTLPTSLSPFPTLPSHPSPLAILSWAFLLLQPPPPCQQQELGFPSQSSTCPLCGIGSSPPRPLQPSALLCPARGGDIVMEIDCSRVTIRTTLRLLGQSFYTDSPNHCAAAQSSGFFVLFSMPSIT